ncbi:SRPBCC family protein [Longimicrobium sp.]|uniref:SRPBCC family protein n=1 Tax=Longimicrobium sp. TaxID=2029185 RepID=UPI002B9BE420|nr:SRPBCC family protein [Longimicrobium sp.]HSU14342.1 SRPBCC family protein [Longimicrobium sp.]
MTTLAPALEIATPADDEIVMTRTFDAPRALVWEAWTRAEHLTRWMLGPEGWTMPVCELDLRPGGAWRFGWRRDDGEEMEMSGEYREVAAPARLEHTERWGGGWADTVNTVAFDEADGRTTVTTRMRYPSRADRDAALATGMKDGAAESLDRLAEYLATMT